MCLRSHSPGGGARATPTPWSARLQGWALRARPPIARSPVLRWELGAFCRLRAQDLVPMPPAASGGAWKGLSVGGKGRKCPPSVPSLDTL